MPPTSTRHSTRRRRRRRRRPRRPRRSPCPRRRKSARRRSILLRRMSKLTGSRKALQFTESVIREMTRLSDAHKAVNLSQGFPDFAAPQAVKDAACAAINADDNQYAITFGQIPLRDAIAREFTRRYGVDVSPDQ